MLENCKHRRDGWCLDCVRAERLAYALQAQEIAQCLGKALNYPWFKDDQKNFPGSTEDDGVCMGEHVPESLAKEAADMLVACAAQVKHIQETARNPHKCDGRMCEYVEGRHECDARSPRNLTCTLVAGHSGSHVACGENVHNMEIWT